MNIASLRQRAAELLGEMSEGLLRLRTQQEPVPPPYSAQLFMLAHVAVGDADSAAVLVADVLALQPNDEATAVRLLVSHLPEGWLSWPGAAGPAEWLRLGLRREQADRLLSVLGEWDAVARIGLALWLLFDVRRDDLDSWLGTRSMADRVAEFVGYAGEGLDIVRPAGDSFECEKVADDLIDAYEPQVGRLVRLHILGCDACRHRVHGLQSASRLLRIALNTFFRATMPADLGRLVAIRRRQMRQPPVQIWKPLLIGAVLLLLYVGVIRKPAATAAPAPPLRDAAQVLDRALNRWSGAGPSTGVLHERVRVGVGPDAPTLERWYDYSGYNRFRVTVKSGDDPPLFDLGTDGSSYVAYLLDGTTFASQGVRVRGERTKQILPLLRQLPIVGSFGVAILPQDYLDLNLFAEASRGNPTLLGLYRWQGRSAYNVLSTTSEGERLILTIDRETLSLLEARIAPQVGVPTTPRRVWTAEVVEVLPRAKVPAKTFEVPVRDTFVELPNPRQIGQHPSAPIHFYEAVVKDLPIPGHLPEPSVLAYLRRSGLGLASVMQVYEGLWSTTLVEGPLLLDGSLPLELDREFTGGRYTEVEHSLPQTTILEFAMRDTPERRVRLYLWHALASDEEREMLILDTLKSMALVGAEQVEHFMSQLASPTLSNLTGVEGQGLEVQQGHSFRTSLYRSLAQLEPQQVPVDRAVAWGTRENAFP